MKIGSLGSTPLIPHHQAGTLKLLAQSTTERAPTLPDVPTFEELGFKGLVLEQWIGVFLPTGTPDAIAIRLNSEANRAIADAAVRQSFSKQALEPVGGGVEQFDRVFREDNAKYARLVKELKITTN